MHKLWCWLIFGVALSEGINDIDAIETATSQFGVIYFIVFFMVKRNDVIRIVDLLSDFSTFGLPRFFDERIRKLNFLLLYCIIILTIATGGVFICPIIFSQSCEKVNQEMNRTKVCGLVTNIWAPFSYSEYPMKQVVIFLESYCCFVNLGCAGFVSFIYVESMEHLIIRIEQLKDLFSDILNEADITVRQHKLKKWVEYHLHIFEIGKMMSDTYRYSLSVIIFCVGILFGCIGVSTMQSSSSHLYSSVFLFLGWFQSTAIVCVTSQSLLDVCLSVGDKVYDSTWYEKDVDFQKAVLMIIIRARTPIYIYAGPFSYMSHLMLLWVIRTSYSYINLLNAT